MKLPNSLAVLSIARKARAYPRMTLQNEQRTRRPRIQVMESDHLDSIQAEWISELRRGNDLTAELIQIQKDWKHAIRQGVLAGLGGVLGATIVVSVLLSALKPFERLTVLKPTLEKISQQLEKGSERK